MPRLVVRNGAQAGRSCPIDGEIVIGRGAECDLPLDDLRISRKHLRITAEKGRLLAEDLETTNGTQLNGKPLQRGILHVGDELLLGDALVSVEDDTMRTFVSATLPLTRTRPRIEAAAPVGQREATASEEVVSQLLKSFETFREIAEALSSSMAVEELLGTTLEELFNLFEQAGRGFVILAGDQGSSFTVQARRFRDAGGEETALSRTIVEHVLNLQEAILSRDAAGDARFADAASIVDYGIRSVLCAPLVCGGEILGAIYIDTPDPNRPFCEADLSTLASLAPQVALRIRHAQLVSEHLESERLATVGATVAGLAHCIKNILNGIQGGSYILEKALANDDAEKRGKGWSLVKRNVAFMSDLVLDMLSYARSREPKRESVDPHRLLESIRDMLNVRAGGEAVEVICQVDPTLEAVQVDVTAMKRCLLNLATNAVEACEAEGGRVELRCVHGPGRRSVCFTVRDNGCGIAEENLDGLFEMFFSTKGNRGTGLGLAVSKKIAEEHGGSIRVHSTVGEGTTFTVELPVEGGER